MQCYILFELLLSFAWIESWKNQEKILKIYLKTPGKGLSWSVGTMHISEIKSAIMVTAKAMCQSNSSSVSCSTACLHQSLFIYLGWVYRWCKSNRNITPLLVIMSVTDVLRTQSRFVFGLVLYSMLTPISFHLFRLSV